MVLQKFSPEGVENIKFLKRDGYFAWPASLNLYSTRRLSPAQLLAVQNKAATAQLKAESNTSHFTIVSTSESPDSEMDSLADLSSLINMKLMDGDDALETMAPLERCKTTQVHVQAHLEQESSNSTDTESVASHEALTPPHDLDDVESTTTCSDITDLDKAPEVTSQEQETTTENITKELDVQPPSGAISCPATIVPTDAPSTRLRHMVANSPSIILCPGVYDGLSARIAIHVGFRGMYMTGAGTTASMLGAADLGIAHLHEMRTNAEMIANLEPDGPPVIADMDTGYGGPLTISRAVKQYARAGVAAFHIEDQVPEKRCGHLAGKEVVDTETYLRRIRTCLDARSQVRSDIIVIARTDALQSRGYDDCVDRLRKARDLGADMGILEGVPSKEMAAQAVQDLAPWPLCYNSVENGHSPLITAEEAQAMGYRLMIFSFAGTGAAYSAIMETFVRLRDHGVTGMTVTPKKIFDVCGLAEEMRIDQASGGSAFAKGV